MELFELPHLSVGAPSEIALPRVCEVEIRDLPEAARGVKPGGQFVGERLVMDKAVCPRRRDGALVEVHGLQRASLDTGNLSAHKSGTILEVLRAICRPGPKRPRVPSKGFPVSGVRVGAYWLALCRSRER